MLGAQWVGGQPGSGVESLGIMTAFGALILFGGRSETIPGLRGDGRNERFAIIDLKATAAAGLTLITAVIIAFLLEVARGHSGNPYAWLGAIAGLAYVIAIAVLRRRSCQPRSHPSAAAKCAPSKGTACDARRHPLPRTTRHRSSRPTAR